MTFFSTYKIIDRSPWINILYMNLVDFDFFWAIHSASILSIDQHATDPWESCLHFKAGQLKSEGYEPCGILQQDEMLNSIQFSRSVMSDSLWPHEPQHTRPPCPSPTPRVHPNPCPLCRWFQPTISTSVVPFSSCPQSFPASGSFPMSQLFASGDQSIGVSASTSVPPTNTQDWPPLGWTGWISLQSKGLSSPPNTTVQKHQFFNAQLFIVQLSHPFMTPGKTIALTRRTFVGKVMSLLFNMLSMLVITFLPRSQRLLISWLQAPSAVILEPPKIKSDTVSTVSPSVFHEVMGSDAMILVF